MEGILGVRVVALSVKCRTNDIICSTKKQYIWRFKLEGKDYTVEMFTSVLSGKKKII
jgi:hypothetical protein